MENEKKIALYRTSEDKEQLKNFAVNAVNGDRRMLYFRILYGFISLVFFAFAVYSLVFLISSGASFQFGMMIYVIVPLIGAGLPFGVVKLKRKEFAEEICEEKGTDIIFSGDRITVQGSKKRKLVRKNDGKVVFERRTSLFTDVDQKLIPFRYEIQLSDLRYYSYSEDEAKLRFVLGTEEYPDIILLRNEAYDEVCTELEAKGIKKTAFIK